VEGTGGAGIGRLNIYDFITNSSRLAFPAQYPVRSGKNMRQVTPFMDSSDRHHAGENPAEFPNSSCRAIPIPSITSFAYCVSDAPNICPHSMHFGNMFICRHASCQAIVKQTANQSI